MKYTKEILEEAVKNSFSYAGTLRFLNEKLTGGLHCHIKRKIIAFGIDTSHFTGQGHNKGKVLKRLPCDQILVVKRNGRRQAGYLLARALIESGIAYECEICKNQGVWLDKKLTLQVDHKNGDWEDHRKENLRFLCPNCHQQTSNFGKKSDRPECQICSKVLKLTKSKYCTDCSNKRPKNNYVKCKNRPSKTELEILIWQKPTSQLAKDYGVSDKAIEKWCKRYGINKPGRGYWAKKHAEVV